MVQMCRTLRGTGCKHRHRHRHTHTQHTAHSTDTDRKTQTQTQRDREASRRVQTRGDARAMQTLEGRREKGAEEKGRDGDV
eukprot:1033688-Rhodomonas_salina.1